MTPTIVSLLAQFSVIRSRRRIQPKGEIKCRRLQGILRQKFDSNSAFNTKKSLVPHNSKFILSLNFIFLISFQSNRNDFSFISPDSPSQLKLVLGQFLCFKVNTLVESLDCLGSILPPKVLTTKTVRKR